MSYLIVIVAALFVAALTLFSGFGLGTLLMPVFAMFFPLKIAIAATAVVHLANNIFKLFLVGRWADYRVVVSFAVPAALAAVVGAFTLAAFAGVEPLHEYELGTKKCTVTTIKVVIAALIAGFTLVELFPGSRGLSFDKKYVPVGGVLSGFFGGLSGHQGALRTAFLIRSGMGKKEFLGTVVVSAVVVDVARLLVYGLTYFGKSFSALEEQGQAGLVVAATIAAFAGSFLGSRLLKKITMETVSRMVGGMLLLLAVALGSGLV